MSDVFKIARQAFREAEHQIKKQPSPAELETVLRYFDRFAPLIYGDDTDKQVLYNGYCHDFPGRSFVSDFTLWKNRENHRMKYQQKRVELFFVRYLNTTKEAYLYIFGRAEEFEESARNLLEEYQELFDRCEARFRADLRIFVEGQFDCPES